MIEYKEIDLTPDQYEQFRGYISFLRACVAENAAKGIDAAFITFCANTHEMVFGRPRPNVKSGAVIIVMFRNLLRKINEYEESHGKESDASATGSVDIRPTDGETKNERRNRRPRR